MSLVFFRRPRLRWLLLAAALAVLATLVFEFTPRPAGPAIATIYVRLPPDSPVTVREVHAAAAPAVHGGLLGVNLAAIQKRVETLGWVKRAEVRRAWPDALVIAITPERAVARWGDHALIDAEGRIFAAQAANASTAFVKLPALDGSPADAAELLAALARAKTALAPLHLRVAALGEGARGELHLVLDDGVRIELGRRDPRAKLARFVTVAAPALATALARAATVDMRYPNGFAVGWKREGHHG